MCRLVLYMGEAIHVSSLVTVPENSLIHQSYDSREREEPLNGDGFGVAWYQPDDHDEAALFRSITPAWNNRNLRHLARAVKSGCILAHVRAASRGSPVNEENTHPFVSGCYSFMHNGDFAAFRHRRRELMDLLDLRYYEIVEGTTDSECLFAHCLQQLGDDSNITAGNMAAALQSAVAVFLSTLRDGRDESPSYVNAVLSNGREAVVSRFASSSAGTAASLHIHTGCLYTLRDGKPELVEAEEDRHAVIVASEPLTNDASWRTVPESTMIVIDASRRVEFRAMKL